MSEDTMAGNGTQPNAANPAQVHAATKLREWKTDEESNDLRLVYQSEAGKRFLLRLLDETRVLLDPFNRDPVQMAHDVGYQAIGRTMIAWLGRADPAAFPTLLLHRLKQKADEEVARGQLTANKKSG